MRTSKRARQLATDVENLILTSPHRHNQAEWGRVTTCGTTACVAGWAAILQGYNPCSYMGDPAPMNQIFTRVRRGTEQSQGIPTVGKAGLGLNKKEANWLFDGDLSRDEVLSGLACIREGDTFKMAEVIKTSREANYSLGCNDYDD